MMKGKAMPATGALRALSAAVLLSAGLPAFAGAAAEIQDPPPSLEVRGELAPMDAETRAPAAAQPQTQTQTSAPAFQSGGQPAVPVAPVEAGGAKPKMDVPDVPAKPEAAVPEVAPQPAGLDPASAAKKKNVRRKAPRKATRKTAKHPRHTSHAVRAAAEPGIDTTPYSGSMQSSFGAN